MVRIDFNPTVPHCSLASVIGLCLRTKINKNIMDRVKLDIVITEGKHSTEEESKTTAQWYSSFFLLNIVYYFSQQTDQ